MDSLLIYFYFVRDCPATSYGNGTLDWFYGQNTLRSAIFSIVVFGFCLIKTCGKKKNSFSVDIFASLLLLVVLVWLAVGVLHPLESNCLSAGFGFSLTGFSQSSWRQFQHIAYGYKAQQ